MLFNFINNILKWGLITYYVVAHMGQNNFASVALYPLWGKGNDGPLVFENYFAIDCMLETILFVYCLLFIYTFYLSSLFFNKKKKLDASRNNILLNSQNNNTTVNFKIMNRQSAENCKGFSETVCQLPEIENLKF